MADGYHRARTKVGWLRAQARCTCGWRGDWHWWARAAHLALRDFWLHYDATEVPV